MERKSKQDKTMKKLTNSQTKAKQQTCLEVHQLHHIFLIFAIYLSSSSSSLNLKLANFIDDKSSKRSISTAMIYVAW